MLFINSQNQVYSGDRQEGDRELSADEHQSWIIEKEKDSKIEELTKQIRDLDIKRIRAIAEPQLKDAESGQTWLEYYTEQIMALRAQL